MKRKTKWFCCCIRVKLSLLMPKIVFVIQILYDILNSLSKIWRLLLNIFSGTVECDVHSIWDASQLTMFIGSFINVNIWIEYCWNVFMITVENSIVQKTATICSATNSIRYDPVCVTLLYLCGYFVLMHEQVLLVRKSIVYC